MDMRGVTHELTRQTIVVAAKLLFIGACIGATVVLLVILATK